jgi:uncharacterized membrane protein YgdD (TMEM256/DUF423 family)
MRLWLFVAGLNGLLAVMAGAYGSHNLEAADPGSRDVFMVAVQYHMWHALALLAVAWLAERRQGRGAIAPSVAGGAFTAGIVLFSGSLYALGLKGSVLVPGAAPVGGALLMIGWAALMVAALKRN